jgi:hydroxymethylpyrimidine pyrophosphatase-like HAD family hydrolase
MGNAPKELMARFEHRTDDNDHDGVAKAITVILNA